MMTVNVVVMVVLVDTEAGRWGHAVVGTVRRQCRVAGCWGRR